MARDWLRSTVEVRSCNSYGTLRRYVVDQPMTFTNQILVVVEVFAAEQGSRF